MDSEIPVNSFFNFFRFLYRNAPPIGTVHAIFRGKLKNILF
jgi:hypothetical protein